MIDHLLQPLVCERFLTDARYQEGHLRVVNALPERRVVGLHSPEIKAVAKQLSREGGEVVTARKLKCRLISKDEKSMTMLELFDDYIKNYAKLVGHTTSKVTHDRYLFVRKRIVEYMEAEYKRSDISVNEVNPKFINGFEIFLRTQFNLQTRHSHKPIFHTNLMCLNFGYEVTPTF